MNRGWPALCLVVRVVLPEGWSPLEELLLW
jgi:hypothetical protein